jgi:acetoin utilization deacetylase AcuC-like enzyme
MQRYPKNLNQSRHGQDCEQDGLFHPPGLLETRNGPGPPECPERLDAIEDRLLVTGVGDALERFEAPEAALADIELAHDRMHVAALRGMTTGWPKN